jgi:hypothetical protein
MGAMPTPEVKSVDSMPRSIVVEFSDGTVCVYNSDFLYAHREEGGNEILSPAHDSNRQPAS